MKIQAILSASLLLTCASSQAIVTVNGVGGGATTFATITEAVDYCILNPSETTIEIATNGPLAGTDMAGKALPGPLTIKAATGFNPLINSEGLWIRPMNESATTVTLQGLNVTLPNASNFALFVGCNVSAQNCHFSMPGVNPYNPTVTCATPTMSTNSELHMTSCSVQGHAPLQAGRAVQSTFLTSCTLLAISDLADAFRGGISNAMNWRPDYTAEYSQAGLGLGAISEPRTLVARNTTIKAGRFLSWPAITLDGFFMANQANTIGDVTMINCVLAGGISSPINNESLPATGNNPKITFQHCTFRKANDLEPWGVLWPQIRCTLSISNCLFDIPYSNYLMVAGPSGGGNPPTVTLEGNNNAYNLLPGVATSFRTPPFDSVQYVRVAPSNTDHVTNASGNVIGDGVALAGGRAMALTPPVTVDRNMEPRPQPTGATFNDIGADEFVESSAVSPWSLY